MRCGRHLPATPEEEHRPLHRNRITLTNHAVLLAILAFVGFAYGYRYWKWIVYLRWKWSAIPYHEQQNRHRQGLCIYCGYDLRASHDRCPECGAAFVRRTT